LLLIIVREMAISNLTYKVVAFSEIPDFNTDECIDWAFEMVSLGYNTPSLLILAGLNKSGNYFQTIEYFNKALTELNLRAKSGQEAILSYSIYLVKKIAVGERGKKHLTELYRFCNSKDYEELIYDFKLLYWAWDDLDYGNEQQSYWPGASADNIESVVKETAEQWLTKNQKHFIQASKTP
jgi:hypothetical protein